MAMNLRLRPEAQDALREASARSGRSQQELIREAVDLFLSRATVEGVRSDLDELVRQGVVRPARGEFRTTPARLVLPSGVTSESILHREDRL